MQLASRKQSLLKWMSTALVVKHIFLLTHSQIQRLERAKLIGKSTLNIHLSKKQVKANIQHRGGFLGMLADLAATALSALLGGLAIVAILAHYCKIIKSIYKP